MDPNETLGRLRTLAAKVIHEADTNDNVTDLESEASDLAESFQALDAWLSKQGFLPDAWKRG